MTEEKYEIQTFKVLSFFQQHPGMVISISYVLLTICGIFYSWSFYEEFGVAILKLVNISDLLTAGIGEPAAILMFLGGFAVAIAAEYLSYYSHQIYTNWKSRPKGFLRSVIVTVLRSPTKNNQLLFMFILIFILYAQLFVSKYAEWQSKQIKQGNGDKLLIKSDALAEQSQELILLGSTLNFVFTYNQPEDEVVIFPVENIVAMLPVRDSEKKQATTKDETSQESELKLEKDLKDELPETGSKGDK